MVWLGDLVEMVVWLGGLVEMVVWMGGLDEMVVCLVRLGGFFGLNAECFNGIVLFFSDE